MIDYYEYLELHDGAIYSGDDLIQSLFINKE